MGKLMEALASVFVFVASVAAGGLLLWFSFECVYWKSSEKEKRLERPLFGREEEIKPSIVWILRQANAVCLRNYNGDKQQQSRFWPQTKVRQSFQPEQTIQPEQGKNRLLDAVLARRALDLSPDSRRRRIN
jgi:hypothetical protein